METNEMVEWIREQFDRFLGWHPEAECAKMDVHITALCNAYGLTVSGNDLLSEIAKAFEKDCDTAGLTVEKSFIGTVPKWTVSLPRVNPSGQSGQH
jgi:hypothetical protein